LSAEKVSETARKVFGKKEQNSEVCKAEFRKRKLRQLPRDRKSEEQESRKIPSNRTTA
jgi:hypothetical protein